MTRSTALANNMARYRIQLVHGAGWILIAALIFLQQPGMTSADTKLDMMIDPAGFLAQAFYPWTDLFTLGQLQNQAYGYFFPQGAFFLATDWLPDWVAQRLWWILTLSIGFSGMLTLLRRLPVGTLPTQVLGATLFSFSPRTLTTLSTISSETWPVMLSPWVLIPFLDKRLNWRNAAVATIPVALMGAVNATATLAACLPAGILLLWRMREGKHVLAVAGLWLIGCALVSFWWMIPLLILGAYAPPFTEFIESATVTTGWLHLIEILRGTTSWTPFVDTERFAGWLLTVEPVFILVTAAIAALGTAGLTRPLPARGMWIWMLMVGIVLMGAAHGPLGEYWISFLDGPGQALRNVHKFDPLVRIPLLIGLVALLPRDLRSSRRAAASSLVALLALAATAPAWSGRLMPQGTWEEIPKYWYEATSYVNEHAANTRSLIVPEASFARQEWGWTRDEPAQPLLEVPWAVRDAIPLIPPEAIRGLDGIMTALRYNPDEGVQALRRLGIGALIIRHDLEEQDPIPTPVEAKSFGKVDVLLIDPQADMMLSDQEPISVSGGGESLALLDMLYGYGPRTLVPQGGEVVTDTPMAVARNYGSLESAVSGPLSHPSEATDVHNRYEDYPSIGQPSRVREGDGRITASSSASDATSWGGANPARSLSAAVDGDRRTTWYPTPGRGEGQWLEIHGDIPAQATLNIRPTEATTLSISNGSAHTEVEAQGDTTVTIPGPPTGTVRITLHERVGIVDLSVEGVDLSRMVSVPPASEDTSMFLLQRLMVDTAVLEREITTVRDMTLEVDSSGHPVNINGVDHLPGDVLELPAGTHHIYSLAEWITLKEPGFHPSPAWQPTGSLIAPSDSPRLLITGRAANPGLQAELDGQGLEARIIDAATQAFIIPADASGELSISFEATRIYQASLIIGGVLAAFTTIACCIIARRWRPQATSGLDSTSNAPLALIGGIVLVAGLPGVAALALAWLITRFTLIPAPVLAAASIGTAGAWLARAGWASSSYAGGEVSVLFACCLGLACLMARRAGSSTNS